MGNLSDRKAFPSVLTILLPFILISLSCAYYNTFYNASQSYEQAMELAAQNPEDPVSLEEELLDEAIAGAAKVLSVYSNSRWADDAQLLLGDALLQSGRRTLTGSGTSDFNEAMMAYSSAIVMTDDREIRDRAGMGLGLAALELHRINDAVASFEEVSRHDRDLFIRSRLHLMKALLEDSRATAALQIADTIGVPNDDSLAAELVLLRGKAFTSAGMPDSGAVLSLRAGEMFGRGKGYYRSLINAAETYIQMEAPQMAVEVLDRLLAGYRSDEETARIALLSGKARQLAGQISGALSSYRSAADLDSYRQYGAEALYSRALLLEEQDRIQDALNDLTEAAGRSGDHIWIRLAADRKKDLELLQEYMDKVQREQDDLWLYRFMVAEKRVDLYGAQDEQALQELRDIAAGGPDMERAMALVELAGILPVTSDSSRSMVMTAYAISGSGDLATKIEEQYSLPRGEGYSSRPAVVVERAWDLMEEMRFEEAHAILNEMLDSPWSRTVRPELLWAAYTAGEGAKVDDGLLQDYLTELTDEYPETEYASAATSRLGGEENGGNE